MGRPNWESTQLTSVGKGLLNSSYKVWLMPLLGTGLISVKTSFLAELNERVEAATSSYSVTGNSLQCIYSVPVSKNHQNI